MPRKPLTERRDPTLPAAGVGWFLTRPGCPTASAGFGAAPQGPGTATTRRWIFCSNPAIYVCGNSIAASGARVPVFYLAIGNAAVTAIHDTVLVALVAQTERYNG